MMKVIELCGMPGCGKSTAFRAFKESYPEAAQKFKGQKDLYPKAKWMWAVLKLLCRVRIGLGLLDVNEKKLTELMNGDGKNVPVYKSKVLALYSRLKKYAATDDCFILDEGLVQHMTSAFYHRNVKVPGYVKDMGDGDEVNQTGDETHVGEGRIKDTGKKNGGLNDPELKNSGIKIMEMPWEYEGIYFYCDLKETVRRNRQRGRNNRYNISDDNELEKILLTKDRNIKAFVLLLCDDVSEIDTGAGKEQCGERMKDILVSLN